MTSKDFKEIIDQSWQLRKEKQFREAELLLHEALANYSPGSFEHNNLKANLADVLQRQGDVEAARQTALEVLEKDPGQVIALTVLGLAALENKQAGEAVENLKKAYQVAPNSFRAGRLARALELDDNLQEAVAVLREALQKNPGDSYLLKQHNALQKKLEAKEPRSEKEPPTPENILPGEIKEDDLIPYAEQMRAKLEKLEPAEAASQLQKVIKVGKRKENPHLYLLLGDLLRKAGDENRAADAYLKARELDPENLLALSQLLYSYRRLDRKEEAWPLLKLLLYHRPDNKAAKSSLIRDAIDLDKARETARFFEELLQKYPQRKELYGAIRKLMNAAEKGETGSQEEG
ncbi:MAG: tetratricopeptide repeat protein [Bacillota bacterium]